MKLKTRLVTFMMIASLVPLLSVFYFGYMSARETIRGIIGQSIQANAIKDAQNISDAIQLQVQDTKSLSAEDFVKAAVKEANQKFRHEKVLPSKRILELDRAWIDSQGYSVKAKEILSNPISTHFSHFKTTGRNYIAEIFLTDIRGETIASTQRLTDYYQADEQWWLDAYNKGKGGVFLDERGFDQSTKLYVLGIVVPVMDAGKAIGILKINFSMVGLLNRLGAGKLYPTDYSAILRPNGLLLAHSQGVPKLIHSPEKIDLLLVGKPGWIMDFHAGSETLMGYAPLSIKVNSRKKTVVNELGIKNEKWHKTPLVLVIESKVQDHFQPFLKLIRSLVIIAVGTVFGAIFFVFYFAGLFIKKQNQLLKENEAVQIRLNKEKEFAKLIIETMSDTVFVSEVESGNPILWNNAQSLVTGFSHEEIATMKAPKDWYETEDLEKSAKSFKRLFDTGQAKFVLQQRTKWGTWIPFEYNVSLVKEKVGEPDYLISIGRDLRERIKSDETIHKEREKAHQYLNIAEVLLYALDQTGHITMINKKGCEILGYKEEELIGRDWFDGFLPKEDVAGVKNVFQSLMKEEMESVKHFENHIITKDGTKKLIQWQNSIVKNKKGKITGMFSSGLDITTQRKHERDLLRLKAAIDHVKDAVCIINNTGEVIYQNSTFETIKQTFPHEILENLLQEKSRSGDSKQFKEVYETLIKNETWQGELAGTDEDQKMAYFRTTIGPLMFDYDIDFQGEKNPEDKMKIIGLILIATDITQEKSHQAQLIQSQKMESLGTLSGGVAHEINNPMGFVASNLNTLQEYAANFLAINESYQKLETYILIENKEAQKLLKELATQKEKLGFDWMVEDMPSLMEELIEGVDRVKAIVKNLREFSHVDEHFLKKANINENLKKALQISQNELKYKCTIIEELGDIPEIDCYPQQLNQVFLNLIINAAQSIVEKGTITLKTYLSHENVIIEVRDDGVGIEAENITKIFEPFFTTKEVGKGTGLGLSVSYRIIEEHQGKIFAISNPGKGTCMTISLPIAQAAELETKK
ncbi:MAG: PAS domain S-box protein [SAR324 cluster bacterium]|nr:PAS domain S-box protein [SAR324 cluster bacterium]